MARMGTNCGSGKPFISGCKLDHHFAFNWNGSLAALGGRVSVYAMHAARNYGEGTPTSLAQWETAMAQRKKQQVEEKKRNGIIKLLGMRFGWNIDSGDLTIGWLEPLTNFDPALKNHSGVYYGYALWQDFASKISFGEDGGGEGEAASGGGIDPSITAGIAVGGGMIGGLEQSYKYGNHNVKYAQRVNGKVRAPTVLTRANQMNATKMASGLKVVGRGVTGLSVAASTYQFVNSDKSGSDYARLTGSLLILGTAAIPFVGPVISIGLGVADSYGAFDGIYNYFD